MTPGRSVRWREIFALGLALSATITPAQRRFRPLASSPILQGDRLPPVLRRAILASTQLRFIGRRTVSVLRDGQPNRHEEIVYRDGPKIRIEFPEGSANAGQVIVENADERRHFLPATNEVMVLPPRREEGLQRLRALAKAGKLTTEAGESIAGFTTIEVTVRDAAGNPLQKLSIEPSSGLMLRRRIFNATGVEVGGFVFTKVTLNPSTMDPNLFQIDRRGVKITTPWDKLRRLAKRGGFLPYGLPDSTGFRLDTVSLEKREEGPILRQVYVGPGGRISLFQVMAAVSANRLRQEGKGKLSTLIWNAQGRSFILVGPQDDATLLKLKAQIDGQ